MEPNQIEPHANRASESPSKFVHARAALVGLTAVAFATAWVATSPGRAAADPRTDVTAALGNAASYGWCKSPSGLISKTSEVVPESAAAVAAGLSMAKLRSPLVAN